MTASQISNVTAPEMRLKRLRLTSRSFEVASGVAPKNDMLLTRKVSGLATTIEALLTAVERNVMSHGI